jgi:hypothetical protein
MRHRRNFKYSHTPEPGDDIVHRRGFSQCSETLLSIARACGSGG